MILVDTNIWINHFNKVDPQLIELLNVGAVACHPFIIGELACGNIKNRVEILSLLNALPSTPIADPNEILEFIDIHALMGKGLGYVDIHLLVSSMLEGILFWTADRRLDKVALDLKISHTTS